MFNINPETGIAFGVISMNSLHYDIWEDVESHCRNLSLDSAMIELASQHLPHELAPGVEHWKDLTPELAQEILEDLGHGELPMSLSEIENPVYEGSIEGIKVRVDWLGGAPIMFVMDSPYTIKADQCSPCIPNAGDLDSLDEDGIICYNVPHDWRA